MSPWPAFLSEHDLRELRHRVGVRKSVAGTRVALEAAGGEGAQYVRLTTGAYQRVEADGSLPKFPRALTPRDLASNAMPYAVTATASRAEVAAPGGQRAVYVPSGGAWRKLLDL